LPALLEPDHLACSPSSDGTAIVLTSGGTGARVPASIASGQAAGEGLPFVLEGLLEMGLARSATWGEDGLVVVTGSGDIASCPLAQHGGSRCERIPAPALSTATAVSATDLGSSLRAAVAESGGRVALLQLLQRGVEAAWEEVGAVHLPEQGHEIVSISLSRDHLLVSVKTGSAFRWGLYDGVPVAPHPHHDAPAGAQKTWQSACVMPDNKIMRLASTWQRESGATQILRPELFL